MIRARGTEQRGNLKDSRTSRLDILHDILSSARRILIRLTNLTSKFEFFPVINFTPDCRSNLLISRTRWKITVLTPNSQTSIARSDPLSTLKKHFLFVWKNWHVYRKPWQCQISSNRIFVRESSDKTDSTHTLCLVREVTRRSISTTHCRSASPVFIAIFTSWFRRRRHFTPGPMQNRSARVLPGEIFTLQFGHVITRDISTRADRCTVRAVCLCSPPPCLISTGIFYANDATLSFFAQVFR